MEKENSFFDMNWSAIEAPLSYALSNQLQQSINTHFDSSLGTIGHLEGFGASVRATLQPQQWSSTATTDRFISHSLNSIPKLNLALVSQGGQVSPFVQGDAAFTERDARMSCFSSGIPNYGTQFPLSETGRLPKGLDLVGHVESNNEISMPSRSSMGEEVELRCIRAESSASEHTVNESNARKRKLIKVGEESSEANAKRSRANETGKSGEDEALPKVDVDAAKGEKPQKEEGAKEAEARKQDYIHVRARRGQATDAHSLAERVRREKISERMKFLQNLVPGCNKVTGKAVMLDEIINYVQSLQRQVEFLSMKLATVNPRLDINVETLRQKDMHQPCGSPSRTVYAMETAPSFPFAHQPPQGTHLQGITSNGMGSHCSSNPLDHMLTRRSLGVPLPMLDGSTKAGSQVGGFWGDDLHRVVQMGSGQNQDGDKEFNGEFNS